ncbi:LuxR C-terminal-related transcriptional regulator [Brucella sp. C7-11G]
MSSLPDRAWMTPLLNRIADAAGERAALILAREKACQKIYIPVDVSDDHWLVSLIGIDAAKALCELFGGNKLEIPPALAGDKRRRAMAIAEMLDKGYSTNVIARSLGVTHKTVQLHRRKTDDGQGTLL